jgi:hypothetical protein
LIHRVIDVKPPMCTEDFELYAQKLALVLPIHRNRAPPSNGARTDCVLQLE